MDLVHIHIGGGSELGILESFVQSLHAGRVGVCVVRATALTLEDLGTFVKKHVLPYRVDQLREKHDIVLQLDETMLQ